MPIVAHSSLPTFEDLRARGQEVLGDAEARTQDIRELHIGLLNMMPDAALQVTERQFIRLVGSASQIVQLHVHPFTVPGLERDPDTQAYIDAHYESFEDLKAQGLDALVVTGANVSNPALDLEPFWDPLVEVMAWATDNVTSVLCSCLATHALLQHFHGVRRRRLVAKRWGVYAHRAVADHPLLRDMNTRFDVPHSRWNAVMSSQVRDAGIDVLVEAEEGDFHLGVSADGFKFVYLQGHPEYDTTSLLKEFKRELDLYAMGEIEGLPPFPDNYLTPRAARIVGAHVEAVITARTAGEAAPPFPEEMIEPLLDNTWTDTGKTIFSNWLGLVYRLTSHDRGVQFMPGVNPADPLGIGFRRSSASATVDSSVLPPDSDISGLQQST